MKRYELGRKIVGKMYVVGVKRVGTGRKCYGNDRKMLGKVGNRAENGRKV